MTLVGAHEMRHQVQVGELMWLYMRNHLGMLLSVCYLLRIYFQLPTLESKTTEGCTAEVRLRGSKRCKLPAFILRLHGFRPSNSTAIPFATASGNDPGRQDLRGGWCVQVIAATVLDGITARKIVATKGPGLPILRFLWIPRTPFYWSILVLRDQNGER